MEKIIQLCFFLFICHSATNTLAQINRDTLQVLSVIEAQHADLLVLPPQKEVFRKNIIKVNLSSFALYNNSFQQFSLKIINGQEQTFWHRNPVLPKSHGK